MPRRLRRWLIAVAVFVVVLLVTPFAWFTLAGPPRFEALSFGRVPGSTAAPDLVPLVPGAFADLGPDVQVTVIFSTGSSGVTAEQAERLRINDLDERGEDGLTDTIMVMVTDGATKRSALLSIPRDTWLFERGHRINATLERVDTQAFVDDVSRITGLPVHHLVEINFTAFADLVDAIGGVAIPIDRPLADLFSVLYVPEPGCWLFSGADALAYARSRHTLTRRDDGRWVSDVLGNDINRTGRQRELIGAVVRELGPWTIATNMPALMSAGSGGARIDADLGIGDLIGLARAMRGVSDGSVEGYVLPVLDQRIGEAAALVINEGPAQVVLDRLRQWPPTEIAAEAAVGAPAVVQISEPAIDAVAAEPVAPAPAPCSSSNATPLEDPRGPLADVAAQG